MVRAESPTMQVPSPRSASVPRSQHENSTNVATANGVNGSSAGEGLVVAIPAAVQRRVIPALDLVGVPLYDAVQFLVNTAAPDLEGNARVCIRIRAGSGGALDGAFTRENCQHLLSPDRALVNVDLTNTTVRDAFALMLGKLGLRLYAEDVDVPEWSATNGVGNAP